MSLPISEMRGLNASNENTFLIEARRTCRPDPLYQFPFYVAYYPWSKEFGLVGLKFKDDHTWTLQSFIRDGKEIWTNKKYN
jgi:hypothetical protein